MVLAVKLKELRLRSRQSLQQVADAVGASKAHIWELESGKSSNPSLDLLRKLSDHFRITVAILIGETLDGMPTDVIRMYRDYSSLSDTEKAVIDDVIEGMKKRKAREGGGES
jgi:transcriptional regulator with XRE-family HTH domain